MKKIILILIILSFFFFCSCKKKIVDNPNTSTDDNEVIIDKSLCYIPLDDRPVNTTRVKYLAAAANFELHMPDVSLYHTALDNQPKNPNLTSFGDSNELIKYIESTTSKYLVISLDQLLSGGLVNSRSMLNDDISFEKELIDRMIVAIGDKNAVIFDTVMRLASTVGYLGYNENEYNTTRNFGSIARQQYTNPSVEEIIAGYDLDESGKKISFNISDTMKENYFKSRSRKLRLTSYYLEKVKDLDNIYTYYGIDDSSNNTNIQTNEINYIKRHLVNGQVFSGTDELGLLSIAKLQTIISGTKVQASVNYFGRKEDSKADAYDTGTLRENVDAHLNSLNVEQVDNGSLSILVLTNPYSTSLISVYVDALISKLEDNIKNNIPTIVIDGSLTRHQGELERRIMEIDNPLLLLGYSNWNTVGNSIGIACSNGITRYLYLTSKEKKTEKANTSFIEMMTFSYVKDLVFKTTAKEFVKNYFTQRNLSTSNFYFEDINMQKISNDIMDHLINTKYTSPTLPMILQKINSSMYITNLINYEVNEVTKEVSIESISFPWYRTFECDFVISQK